MLEPSSSEEDEDYEPSSGIQNNVKDNNLKPPVANGGPRPVSPSTTDGKAGGKVNILIFLVPSGAQEMLIFVHSSIRPSLRSKLI